MYYLFWEDVDNYRAAIGKIAFLKLYHQYTLIEDIPDSNCVIALNNESKKRNILSFFRKPQGMTGKHQEEIIVFYQKAAFFRIRNKSIDDMFMMLGEDFDSLYNNLFEWAISDPDTFVNELEEDYKPFVLKILNKKRDYYGQRRYKYYSENAMMNPERRIFDGRISFCSPQTFNDPFDINCCFKDGTDFSDLFRVLCAAPSEDMILLWSYYSTDHKGCCVEYSDDDIMEVVRNEKRAGICIVGPVKYTDKRPDQRSSLNRISYSELKFYVDVAFSKYNEWEHEQEYRYVMLFTDRKAKIPTYLNYDISPQHIYLGCKSTIEPGLLKCPVTKLRKDDLVYRIV